MSQLLGLKNVSFRYAKASSWALSDVSFEVKPGEHVFIQGESGSGKSTLLNLVSGIHRCTTGEMVVCGQPFHELSESKRDKCRGENLAVVFQQFNLVGHLSAKDNITLGQYLSRQPAKEKADELLVRLGIPNELHNSPASKLSLGQQQRVAIARALSRDCQLIICDEATSALDHRSRDKFINELKDLCKDKAILFVSHDPSLSDHFHRTLTLNQGQLCSSN